MARTVMTMARMRSLGLTGLCLAVLAGAGGCVSQQEYDNLADANLATSSRLEELRRENNGLQLEIEERQGRIGDLESQIGGLESTRNSMRDQIEEVLGYQLEHDDALLHPPAIHSDHLGIGKQRDGNFYVGVPIGRGRWTAQNMADIAGLAEKYATGDKRIRTTSKQNTNKTPAICTLEVTTIPKIK